MINLVLQLQRRHCLQPRSRLLTIAFLIQRISVISDTIFFINLQSSIKVLRQQLLDHLQKTLKILQNADHEIISLDIPFGFLNSVLSFFLAGTGISTQVGNRVPDRTDAFPAVIWNALVERLVPYVERHVVGRGFFEAGARVSVSGEVVEWGETVDWIANEVHVDWGGEVVRFKVDEVLVPGEYWKKSKKS